MIFGATFFLTLYSFNFIHFRLQPFKITTSMCISIDYTYTCMCIDGFDYCRFFNIFFLWKKVWDSTLYINESCQKQLCTILSMFAIKKSPLIWKIFCFFLQTFFYIYDLIDKNVYWLYINFQWCTYIITCALSFDDYHGHCRGHSSSSTYIILLSSSLTFLSSTYASFPSSCVFLS